MAGANNGNFVQQQLMAHNTPLIIATLRGDVAEVGRLIGARVDVNEAQLVSGYTALYLAIRLQNEAIVERLLAAPGIDVNKTINGGFPPIYIASQIGNHRILERLLAVPGIDVNKPSDGGFLPLYIAAQKGHHRVVEMLLQKPEINVNQLSSGFTPLYTAAQNGHHQVVEMLLRNPAIDVNQKSAEGIAPLFVAAHDRHLQVVEMLLAAPGIEINEDSQFGTPLSIARAKGHVEIARLLEASLPKWKGFSRLDISILNTIFETEAPAGGRSAAENTTCCPVCLKVVPSGRATPQITDRVDGCMYILDHNCSTAGGYYHKELYNKYKNPDGTICWCTICGRICERYGHKHYAAGLAQGPTTAVLRHLVADPYGQEADCIKYGGGGYKEKLMRFRRMREYAAELQEQIDTKIFEDAANELIEETWNAPLMRFGKLNKMIREKKFNIPNNAFPNIRNEVFRAEIIDIPWPFERRPAMMPILEPGFSDAAKEAIAKARAQEGANVAAINRNVRNARFPDVARPLLAEDANIFIQNEISMADLVIKIRLVHRKLDGTIKTHTGIPLELLFGQIINTISPKITDTFGKCILEGCTGMHYPGELQYILDNYRHESLDEATRKNYQAKTDLYRDRFNEMHAEYFVLRSRVNRDIAAARAMPMGGAGAAAPGPAGGAGAGAAAPAGGAGAAAPAGPAGAAAPAGGAGAAAPAGGPAGGAAGGAGAAAPAGPAGGAGAAAGGAGAAAPAGPAGGAGAAAGGPAGGAGAAAGGPAGGAAGGAAPAGGAAGGAAPAVGPAGGAAPAVGPAGGAAPAVGPAGGAAPAVGPAGGAAPAGGAGAAVGAAAPAGGAGAAAPAGAGIAAAQARAQAAGARAQAAARAGAPMAEILAAVREANEAARAVVQEIEAGAPQRAAELARVQAMVAALRGPGAGPGAGAGAGAGQGGGSRRNHMRTRAHRQRNRHNRRKTRR
jgi:ankyrin repeat protein